MPYNTDQSRWRALTVRDPNADGHFVYSVKSTRCYCRPTCPARLARRANVGFYQTAQEAEAAGFRACKRCKPELGLVDNPQDRAVARACALIEAVISGDLSTSLKLQDLANSVGFTPRYFHKIFKDKMGVSPKEYAKSREREGVQPIASTQPEEGDISPDMFDFDGLDIFEVPHATANLDFDMALITDTSRWLNDVDDPLQAVFGEKVGFDMSSAPLFFAPGVRLDDHQTGHTDYSLDGNTPEVSLQTGVPSIGVVDSLTQSAPEEPSSAIIWGSTYARWIGDSDMIGDDAR